MASDIFVSGLASGIDTDSIIEKLMTLERRPQLLMQQKSLVLGEKKNIYSSLSAKLSALSTVVDKFSDIADPFFSQKTVSTSDSKIAQANISGSNPAVGSFQLDVTQLATAAMVSGSEGLYTGSDNTAQPAQTESSAAINAVSLSVDPTQSLASEAGNFNTMPQSSGTLELNGVSIAWDDSMSLNDIIGLINNSSANVTASFDEGTQVFSIESNQTGGNAQITTDETGGNLLEALNLTADTFTGADAVLPSLSEAIGTAAANLDITVTSGTFTINDVVFHVDATTDSLQTVLARINNSNAGVSASYDETSGKVSLFQKETGTSKEIVLGATGDTSNILYALKLSATNPPVGGVGDTYAGTDAVVSFNGGANQNYSTNEIQGMIPGVTVNLKSVGTATVQVSTDVDSMVDTIQEFVDEYNGVMNYINTKTREDRVENPQTAAEKLQGTFISDPLFLETKSSLGSIISSAVSGLPGDMNQLAQIGITTSSANYGKDGTLTINESDLRAALLSDPDGVKDLFTDETNGIMTQLETKLDSMTDSVFGNFKLEEDALQGEMDVIDKRVDDMETILQKREESLRLQFSNMEVAVAKLNSMGAQLAGLA